MTIEPSENQRITSQNTVVKIESSSPPSSTITEPSNKPRATSSKTVAKMEPPTSLFSNAMEGPSKKPRTTSPGTSSYKNPFTMRNWLNLPTELLESIATKLYNNNFVDAVRFRAVCKSWNSIPPQRVTPPNIPWLFLTCNTTHFVFFSLSDNRNYRFDAKICSREPWFCGSCNGWLLMVDGALDISIINPITKAEISLPSLERLPGMSRVPADINKQKLQETAIIKAVVSSSVSPNSECVVMVVYAKANALAFCRPTDTDWTAVHRFLNSREHCSYDDVAYSEGKFYAVNNYGRVVVFDFDVPSATEVKPANMVRADKSYIVESSGDFLVVSRYRGWSCDLEKVYKTVFFEVFERNRTAGNWVKTKNLGDRTLFLGTNQSVSVVASNFSEIKGNCIYFTDNITKELRGVLAELHDVGIYHLADGLIDSLPGYFNAAQFVKQPPMWITPSPA